ncbi:MAG: hypothetical protein AAF566_13210 [Pseudomonadota bacterium]
MSQADRSSVTALHALPQRARLTTTHPHGALWCRADGKLALLRISKNASTELMNRLNCQTWQPFADVEAPVVLFLRDPVRRFLSSISETLMRVQHTAIEDPQTNDRVVVSEDIYAALERVIAGPVDRIIDLMIDLIEEAPFDAHHEHQISFFTERDGTPRFDARLYSVEHIEAGLEKIGSRYDIAITRPPAPVGDRFNIGGAKPVSGATGFRIMMRKMTRTGLYRRLPRPPLLASRVPGRSKGVIERRDLNAMANDFAADVKAAGLNDAQRARVKRIYQADIALWSRIKDDDDRLLSDLF